MEHGRGGSLKAEVGPVSVQAGIVGEALCVAAKIELIVRGVEAAIVQQQFSFIVALEASASHHIEHAVGTIAVFGGVSTALHFDLIDVLGIELRTNIAGNIRIWHGDAIQQPGDLVTTADVELVVNHHSPRHEVGNHSQVVGAVGSR